MFKDFELPFVPFMVVMLCLLIWVTGRISESSTTTRDDIQSLHSHGCTFDGETLTVPVDVDPRSVVPIASRIARECGVKSFDVLRTP